MAEELFAEIGPNGNIQAVVESEDGVCFFYLFAAPETELQMKSVWVRNHVAAPQTLEVERMRSGDCPRNPAPHCRFPQGQPLLSKERIRVVWLPEGNGAALYEGDEILAIIPPWSGMEGFHGYARDCVGEGPLAWELNSDNALIQRFEDAQSFWMEWNNDGLWPSIQSSLLSSIEAAFGKYSNYYAIDGGNWPPKAIVRIPRQDCVILATIGISVRPQPNVEMHTDQPECLRRIELGSILPKTWPDNAIKKFAAYLSAQSGFPWTRYTWLGAGHTIPCDSWQNPNFTFSLLSNRQSGLPPLRFNPQFDDPVSMLWFTPISADEREIAVGTGSEKLMTKLPALRWQDA